jgi:hypothetical protein
MSTLAEDLRNAGIQIGDVVETVSNANPISKAIVEAIGERSYQREGELIEVTAIGEQNILGYWLVGRPVKESEAGYAYRLFVWCRDGHESSFSGARLYFRKIGSRRDGEYIWINPDMANVYARCQKGV